VKARQMPEEITESGVLPIILLYNYVVSAVGGILYCIGLYFCCRIRSHGLLLLSELRQSNFELSSVYQPLETEHLEQLESCIVGREEAQGATCTICYENFESGGGRPLKLPLCSHIYHEDCIKDWLKMRPTCPYCRSDVRQALSSQAS
jgi:hypothetical protein